MNNNENNILLEVNNLKKYFPVRKGVLKRVKGHVHAVDDVNFFIRDGETLGLVGESGCGKSSVGRCIVRLIEPTSGEIQFRMKDDYHDITKLDNEGLAEARRNIQIVFQDPLSSLDPRMNAGNIIGEPLKANAGYNRKQRNDRVAELLEQVGLSANQMNRYPHEFSGGQKQRIGIARSLALNPDLVICDEPVAALDVSVQAQILNLLEDLQDKFGLTYLFVAHDLSVVEHVSDRVMVMYLGKIVEMAASEVLYKKPHHPYTEALMHSIPVGDPKSQKERQPLQGGVPDPSDPPSGCYFHPRCPYKQKICEEQQPELKPRQDNLDHYSACHFADSLDLDGFYV